MRECEGNDDDELLDINTGYLCSIHGHMILMMRNVALRELTAPRVTSIVCGMVFLSTRHEWNVNLLDKQGANAFDGWRLPEHEIYEVMHVLRRKLTSKLRQDAAQHVLDGVMDSVVRVSASSGALLPRPDEVPSRWAYVCGPRNAGRFALHSSRGKQTAVDAAPPKPRREGTEGLDLAPTGSGGATTTEATPKSAGEAVDAPPSAAPEELPSEEIPSMEDGSHLAVEVDVQVMQLTLKASHPMALPGDVARLRDVVEIFGAVSMQV